MNEVLFPVKPTKPVAPWLGGKSALAGRITQRIEAVQHTIYAEPFVGMGGVFFRRAARPRKEVINDISRDVVNLFRLLQRHYQQLLDVMKWQVCSRADFDRLRATDPANLTDLERGVRFLFLQRASFGGMGKHYGVSRNTSARFDLIKLMPRLEEIHERLCGVDIECLPYAGFVARYDTPTTLFYLDPPYFGNEGDYGPGIFSRDDFGLLRGILDSLQGHFILSINDHPAVREIFAGFQMEEVSLNYRVSGKATPANELIISG
jgi:DNA adenine methylase